MEKQFLIDIFGVSGFLFGLLAFFTIILQLMYVRKNKQRIAELLLTPDNPWTQTKKQIGIFDYIGFFSIGIAQAYFLYIWPHKNKKNMIALFPGIYTKKNYTALVEENPYLIKLNKVGLILVAGSFLFGAVMIYLQDYT